MTRTRSKPQRVEHEITVCAPASAVYGLIADVTQWPRLFPPTIHVDTLDTGEDTERIRIWATANDEVKNWTSLRVLNPQALRIEFRQEVSSAPVASMGGTWIIEELAADRSRVRLLHDYRAIDDDPAALAWIEAAVDRNSHSELAALKRNVEAGAGDSTSDDLLLSFEDTVQVDGRRADVYDFLNQAQEWQQRLPHVARVLLTENVPGHQVLEMDTRTADGSVHTTRSVRVCFAPERIVYKQIGLPTLMTLHTGFWRLRDEAGGVAVTSQHTVMINPDTVQAVLGAGADVARARQFVRTALSTNSRATLDHAKAYAEARGRWR
jgi:aromatase